MTLSQYNLDFEISKGYTSSKINALYQGLSPHAPRSKIGHRARLDEPTLDA